jgi:hypothetical protein
MTTKTIYVLANSLKNQHRCVAGREVLTDGVTKTWGGWLRPVSRHDHGAVATYECKLRGGKLPEPLDVVTLKVKGHEDDWAQPENWIIDDSQKWEKQDEWGSEIAARLEDTPQSLWAEPDAETDRAREPFLATVSNFQSLQLIRPADFRLSVQTKTWSGGQQKKRRALFYYQGVSYNLALTDPVIGDRYFQDFEDMRDQDIKPRCGDNCLLTVSLTPEFNGFHYKIVAAVIELG